MSILDEAQNAMNHLGVSAAKPHMVLRTENTVLLMTEIWFPEDWTFTPPTVRDVEAEASVSRKDVEKLIVIAESLIDHASVHDGYFHNCPICARARDTVRPIKAKLGEPGEGA